MIFWATAIPGRFPGSDSVGQRTLRGIRHGSAFRVPEFVLDDFLALDSARIK